MIDTFALRRQAAETAYKIALARGERIQTASDAYLLTSTIVRLAVEVAGRTIPVTVGTDSDNAALAELLGEAARGAGA